MAIFKRSVLKDKGLTDDQIDYLMTESNRALAADYMPKADLQAQIDAAVDAAKADTQITDEMIQGSEAYKAVQAELDKVKAINSEDYSGIKPKFREQVYGMIDRSEGAAAVADQLAKIQEGYSEYFQDTTPAPAPKTPVYSGEQPKPGAVPSPEDAVKARINDLWK